LWNPKGFEEKGRPKKMRGEKAPSLKRGRKTAGDICGAKRGREKSAQKEKRPKEKVRMSPPIMCRKNPAQIAPKAAPSPV